MPARPLTQALVDDLEPREAVHTLRDGALRGFGVRVLPSGRKRFFIHIQNERAADLEDRRRRRHPSPRRGAPPRKRPSRRDVAARAVRPPRSRRRRGSRTWPRRSFAATAGTGSRARARSTGAISATRSCPGSKGGRSPTSPGTTSSAGSPPCTPPPSRRTAPPPSSRSSCARPRSTATAAKAPTPARGCVDTGARAASGSCPSRSCAASPLRWSATRRAAPSSSPWSGSCC